MNVVTATYQRSVPEGFRRRFWQLRHAAWSGLSARDPLARRSARADIRVAFGMPTAEVRIGSAVLTVDLRDEGVGRPLYVQRNYELAETAFLMRTLRPRMAFVDIGANIGYFTTLAAASVGRDGRVIAIEPEPHNLDILRANVARNCKDNTIVVPTALGAKAGEAKLFRADSNYGDHRLYNNDESERSAVSVKVASLDDVLSSLSVERVDVIKIDVQGFECEVLEGMRSVLAGSSPLSVLAEFWPHGLTQSGGSPDRFLNAFSSAGFRMHLLNRDGSLKRIDREEMMVSLPAFDPCDPDKSYLNVVFQR